MVQKSWRSKAVSKLGKTDWLLLKISSLPEEDKDTVTDLLINEKNRILFSTAVIAISCVAAIASIGLLIIMVPFADFSTKETYRWWIGLTIASIGSVWFAIASASHVLSAWRERADLRQLLIHGGKRETQQ